MITNITVSMMRFSAAITLYGIQQMERSWNIVEDRSALSKTLDGFEKTMNSLTDVLKRELDEDKRKTLASITSASKDAVGRTLDLFDPDDVLRASGELLQKSSDVTAQWLTKAASAVKKITDTEPAIEFEPEPVATP